MIGPHICAIYNYTWYIRHLIGYIHPVYKSNNLKIFSESPISDLCELIYFECPPFWDKTISKCRMKTVKRLRLLRSSKERRSFGFWRKTSLENKIEFKHDLSQCSIPIHAKCLSFCFFLFSFGEIFALLRNPATCCTLVDEELILGCGLEKIYVRQRWFKFKRLLAF